MTHLDNIARLKREHFDEALLFLLVELAGDADVDGEEFLTQVIREATDAVARLKEQGMVRSD